jgi:uncharacterized protein
MTKKTTLQKVKILFDINHPAHAHFFKHVILELKQRDNFCVYVTSTKKEVSEVILDAYKIKHITLGYYRDGLILKFIDFVRIAVQYMCRIRIIKPDLVLSMSSARPFARLVSRASTYIFDDTEHAWEQIALYKPFATKIFTPDCFIKELGQKQVRYPGYHQLAYLHPKRFSPNSDVLSEIGLEESSVFFVIRFVAWNATHDLDQKGISNDNKKLLVEMLSSLGRVIISSEQKLPDEFEQYRISVCPSKTHDLLYYAKLYIGEGATMASECAVLGTPAIYINSLNLGYIQEQERLGLLYSLRDDSKLIALVKHLLDKNLVDKKQQRIKATKALAGKIDVTSYILKTIDDFVLKNNDQRII